MVTNWGWEPIGSRVMGSTNWMSYLTGPVRHDWMDYAMEPVRQVVRDILFPPGLRAAIEGLREQHVPRNWPREADIDRVVTVIQDDGLPLVWVPPAHVVAAVLAAPGRQARVDVLLEHADELVPDCRRVLTEVNAERMARQLPLAPRALDAFEAGQHEAALTLAVVVTDAVVATWIPGGFEAVAKSVQFDPKRPVHLLRLGAAVAPLKNFKQRYFAEKGDIRPDALNRQVTVHYADAEHFTRGNALVACLLMTSVLRALQEFQGRVAA